MDWLVVRSVGVAIDHHSLHTAEKVMRYQNMIFRLRAIWGLGLAQQCNSADCK